MNEINYQLPFRDTEEATPGDQKILFIVNPVSGRMKSKTGLVDILDELYRKDGAPVTDRRVTVAVTMYRGHAAELAASSHNEGYDTVICCGGDGTLSETIEGLLQIPEEHRPPLGYIPAGSTNDFATSVGIPTSLRDAARMAVHAKPFALDIGRFEPMGDHPTRHFTYIASFGLFTSVSYSTPQHFKNVMGHSAYLLSGMKDISNLQPRSCTFILDGTRKVEGNFVFGAITNTISAAGVVQLPEDQVSLSDGELEVFLIHMPEDPLDFHIILNSLAEMEFDTCPLIEFHHAKTVDVILDGPTSWSLDGEEATSGSRVRIDCVPAAIRFRADSQI